MTNLDSSALATYNSLVDPHLQCYFSNERIRSHLKHAGLINRRGEIISDGEYRMKLVRREHKKHVRQMLAENIVHRAIDMERARQAEIRRQIDIVAKAALVNSVKESRRRIGYSSANLSGSHDIGGPSIHSSWSQARPKSASHHHDLAVLTEELANPPRVRSAHVHHDQRRKPISKSPVRHSRYLNRPKSSGAQRSSPSQRPRSPVKPSEPPCQIKMIYYGPHTKIDYDHSLFEPVDEIMVMQQHCGGENLIVYKDNLKAGDAFQFNSRRHSDYPFGLSLYVKGLIDSRISTCCEYKHRHGVRLGGERGHFAIISVEGSKPCLKCRFEKQAQLKQNADDDENDDDGGGGHAKPITISIPAINQPKSKQTPVKIPVRRTSNSNDNYSDDFDGSEKQKPIHSRPKSPTETSTTSTVKSDEKPPTKTWQITFHTSNIPTGSFNLPKKASSNALLKFSLISIDGNDETEQYVIQMKDFPQCFKSARQDSFRAQLQSIGKPEQLRLKLEVTGHEPEEIKWHLDHIDVIDPETQAHYKFPCNQWIRPSEEKLLTQSDSSRKSSSSTNNSKSSNQKKAESKAKVSSRSSSSSYESPKRYELIPKPIQPPRRISTDNESNDQNKVHYRVVIHPSEDADGEFHALNDSKIFLRINNQTKNSSLFKKETKQCPTFEAGEHQSFEIDLRQNINEQPTKLTIGYYNTDIAAGQWKLQKIVLINTETGEETIFPCKQTLVRNDYNLRAEQTFQVQSKQSDDEEQSTPRNPKAKKQIGSSSESDGNTRSKPVQSSKVTHKRSSSSESNEKPAIKNENGQSFSRPKTRRGRDDPPSSDDKQGNSSNKNRLDSDVWRPSSSLNKNDSVDPLVGLDDLQSQTGRSTEEKNSSATPFKEWYPKDTEDDD